MHKPSGLKTKKGKEERVNENMGMEGRRGWSEKEHVLEGGR